MTPLAQRGDVAAKSTRTYSLARGEGIWRAWAMGGATAYIASSGKLFTATEEGGSTEVYPARELDRVMYPVFACPIDTESMYLGEQESGDLLSINLSTRETTVLKSGTEPFTGASSYAPADLVYASMESEQNFAGVVHNEAEGRYELILSVDGQVSVVASARAGFARTLGAAIVWFFVWLAALAALLWAAAALVRLAAGTPHAGREADDGGRAAAGAGRGAVAAAFRTARTRRPSAPALKSRSWTRATC